jgi:mono/diheme cytochrome c family protein
MKTANHMKPILTLFTALLLAPVAALHGAEKPPQPIATLIEQNCAECHDAEMKKGNLDLTTLTFDLADPKGMNRWVRIHDRIEKGEMPPQADDLPSESRATLVEFLSREIDAADMADVKAHGRGPIRRLTRGEYQNNLRELLQMPHLQIAESLPPDRVSHGFDKITDSLDMSDVQAAAYLKAAETVLRAALAPSVEPPPSQTYRADALAMIRPNQNFFGGQRAFYHALENRRLEKDEAGELSKNADRRQQVEAVFFRTSFQATRHHVKGFAAKTAGRYRVRFSARAVKDLGDYKLVEADEPAGCNLIASVDRFLNPDNRVASGNFTVRAKREVFEAVVDLLPGETVELNPLGLPIPRPTTIKMPPLPEGGYPGIAYQWVEIEGPLRDGDWPPPSHRVLFGELPIRAAPEGGDWPVEAAADKPDEIMPDLVTRFARLCSRGVMPAEDVKIYIDLAHAELAAGKPFMDAVLAAYKGILCSGHFLYLREPTRAVDQFAIASRLSHFLTDGPPDKLLRQASFDRTLRRREVLIDHTRRLIGHEDFEQFIRHFTDYWLDLRHLRRDAPDERLYPEYRLHDYLHDSMADETRAYVRHLLRNNRPVGEIVASDYIFANDLLARQYGLPPVADADVRLVRLPSGSPYGGLMTQGAVLKVTSNGTTTSPILRGVWVLETLVGHEVPPPPPTVPGIEPDVRGASTVREIIARHKESRSCASCHRKFDHYGLALENFDIMGAWRDRYRGLEEGEVVKGIDRTGNSFRYTLARSVDASGELEDGRTFRDVRELKAILLEDPRQLARNFVHQLLAYATGVPVRFSDRREIEVILDSCAPDGYLCRDLLEELVCSRLFLGELGLQAQP